MFDPFSLKFSDVQRAMNKAASTYDAAFSLKQKATLALVDRLQYFNTPIQSVLDIGCATGFSARVLEKHYKPAKIIAFDASFEMLKQARRQAPWFSRERFMLGDMQSLPFLSKSFDLLFSDLTLHWGTDVQEILSEWQRVLKPTGLLMFSCLGAEGLSPIAEVWAELGEEVRLHRFIQSHLLGDALLNAGFKDPLVEVERVQIQFDSVLGFFKRLKSLGMSNINAARARGLLGKQRWKVLCDALKPYQNNEGQFTIYFEIIFAHASVATYEKNVQSGTLGEISIPISQIKRRR